MDSLRPVNSMQSNVCSIRVEEHAISHLVQLSASDKQKGKRKIEQIEVGTNAKSIGVKKMRSTKSPSQLILKPNSFVKLICEPLIDLQKKAIAHLSIKEYSKAKEHFVKMLKLRRNVDFNQIIISKEETIDNKIIKKINKFKEKTFSIAQILDRLGFASLFLGENEQAQSYVLEAYNLKKAMPEQEQAHAGLLTTINLLGKISIYLKEDQAVQKYHEEAKTFLARNPNLSKVSVKQIPENTAQQLSEIGCNYYNESSYEAAKPYFEKAIEILEQIEDCDLDTIVDCIKRLGYINYALDNNHEAKIHFERAFKLLNQNPVQDEDSKVYLYQHLGLVNYDLKEYSEAKICFLNAIETLSTDLGDSESELLPLLHRRLGKTYYQLEDYQNAKDILERALSQLKENYETEIIDVLNTLGKVNHQLNLQAEAIQYWVCVLAKIESSEEQNSLLVHKLKLRIALAATLLGNVNVAQDLL